MALRIQLFGAPAFMQDEKPITLSRRKAMALLAYLAVTRTSHQRDALAALLWPESEASAAYSALRNVLWILRQTPLAEALRSDRSTIGIKADGVVHVDVLRFRALTEECPSGSHGPTTVCRICEPLLRKAVSLWRNPFMSGFSISGSTRYDDWQFAEAAALKRELTAVLDRMIDYYMSIGDAGQSVQYARRWIRADTLNELGYRSLMRALLAQGNRAEALQAYAECSRVLAQELGLSPEDSTAELAEEIRGHQEGDDSSDTPNRLSDLPHALVPIIGRQDAVLRIEQMLLHDQVRFLTIAGLGGSGKTSLALHVARRLESHFEQGVCFVPLDAIRGENVVASTVAQALDISLPRARSPKLVEQLADSLHERKILLILDGAEHVLSQVRELLPALKRAPGVRLLVTSRVALSAESETVVPLHGLEYPDATVPVEHVAEYAAVRLLRVAARRHGQAPENNDADLVGMSRLSRLLEGIPLGLEMAASWRSVLSWEEIADRVSDNLEFLTHVRDDAPPRHRAFVAVFEQAWSLLSAEAQATLCRLSCFRNSFAVDAVENVAEGSPSSLALLVNRSLVKRVGPTRYAIHELLRQFASGKLGADAVEIDRVRARHSEFYLRSVAEWAHCLTGPDQFSTLALMGQEIGNVRVAFHYAAQVGYDELLRDACEGLFFYYDMRTQFEEAMSVFAAAADAYARHEHRDEEVHAFLVVAQGWFGHQTCPENAAAHMRRGLGLLTSCAAQSRLQAMCYVICGYANAFGDLEKHVQQVGLSIAYYRDHGDLWGEGLATGAYAALESWRDSTLAESLSYQSLRLHREAGDAWGEGMALSLLAIMAELRGDFELARERYQESQRLSEPIANDIIGVLYAVIGQSRVTAKIGDMITSETLAERALQLCRGTGYRLPTGMALLQLARAYKVRGDRAAAEGAAFEAFSLISQRMWNDKQSECALFLLELSLEDEDLGAAERWYREVRALTPKREGLPILEAKLHSLRNGSDNQRG